MAKATCHQWGECTYH